MEMPLWTPSKEQIEASPMDGLRRWCAETFQVSLPDHDALHAWSIDQPGQFWSAVWEVCGVIGERGERALIDGKRMLDAQFFPDARLNFAENLLRRTGPDDALVFRGEDKVGYRWSWDKLHAEVSKLQQAFRAMGLGEGDRIAAMMPNMPETIACMLAASSIGAIWSSCSPDFGEQGVLDRFGQIAPKLFIACDGYWYNGKLQDVSAKVQHVARQLGCPVMVVHYAGDAEALAGSLADGRSYQAMTEAFTPAPLDFVRLPFSQPLYILFSSGTTGVPKCIVHSAGGMLLQHLKEQRFHCGLREGERLFYFTTCGWMMWNWLASGLSSGATLCLFDGSPFAPSGEVLWDYAAEEKFAVFGTSA